MEHKQILILLKLHVEMVENYTFKATLAIFIKKCQQVGVRIAM